MCGTHCSRYQGKGKQKVPYSLAFEEPGVTLAPGCMPPCAGLALCPSSTAVTLTCARACALSQLFLCIRAIYASITALVFVQVVRSSAQCSACVTLTAQGTCVRGCYIMATRAAQASTCMDNGLSVKTLAFSQGHAVQMLAACTTCATLCTTWCLSSDQRPCQFDDA